VRFDGRLTVLDSARFAETLAAGVGRAKGFGFGLLSVLRAED
jgi:CRISPR system Cascade subunit CasE